MASNQPLGPGTPQLSPRPPHGPRRPSGQRPLRGALAAAAAAAEVRAAAAAQLLFGGAGGGARVPAELRNAVAPGEKGTPGPMAGLQRGW